LNKKKNKKKQQSKSGQQKTLIGHQKMYWISAGPQTLEEGRTGLLLFPFGPYVLHLLNVVFGFAGNLIPWCGIMNLNELKWLMLLASESHFLDHLARP
jgi:hypothetical protein